MILTGTWISAAASYRDLELILFEKFNDFTSTRDAGIAISIIAEFLSILIYLTNLFNFKKLANFIEKHYFVIKSMKIKNYYDFEFF